MDSREVNRNLHPPACTCVDCVNKRLKRTGITPRKHDKRHPKHSLRTYQPKYHPPTLRLSTRDKQTRVKHEYPRHVRIIANIILTLAVIFAIGLVGSGIYGVAKYHDNAWHWISQISRNLADNVITLIDDIPKLVNASKNKIADSEIGKTITDAINEAKTPKPETIKPPTSITPVTKPATLSSNPVSDEQRALSIGKQVVTIVNSIRAERGSPELIWDDTLYEYSLAHSKDMAQQRRLFHTDINLPYGENAWGGEGSKSWSAKTIVESWMGSPKHRTWLLNPHLKHVAVGIAYSSNGMYASWTFWKGETIHSDWWYQYTPDNPPDWWY